MAEDVTFRPATPAERPAVANVLDGAALSVEPDYLRRAIAAGDVFVAVACDVDAPDADSTEVDAPDADSTEVDAPDANAADDARILGALVLHGDEILAVAVRRRRRDQGIGTALVEAADERRDRLVAECDAAVRPFWSSLGFEVAPTDEAGRYVAVR